MSDSDVQIAPDGSGKLIDTSSLSTGAGTVQRQRVALGDPSTGAALAAVKNSSAGGSDYGLVTRPVNQNWVEQVNLNPGNTLPIASATFNSTAIDLTDLSSGGPGFSKWRVLINIDQTGTLTIQQSPDNSNWYATLQGLSIVSGQAFIFESLIVLRYLRAHYVNGGTGLATFVLRSYLVSI